MNYTRVVEIYDFDEDSISVWNRYFFDGSGDDPVANLGGGSDGLGAFSFTSAADGTVNVTLINTYQVDEANRQDYLPLKRTLRLADGRLSATGLGSQDIVLQHDNGTMEGKVANWNQALHGGGEKSFDTNYNINTDPKAMGGTCFINDSNWYQKKTIYCYTDDPGSSKGNAAFYGNAIGSLTGDLDFAQCAANSQSGLLIGLENTGKGVKEVIEKGMEAYTKGMAGDVIGTVTNGYAMAKAGYDLFGVLGSISSGGSGDVAEPTAYKGTVNLKLSTCLDMKGQFTTDVLLDGINSVTSPMKYFNFKGTHLGEGVWNLRYAAVSY